MEFEEEAKGAVEKEVGEEAVRAKARRTEPVPSQREVEEHNLDHGVFRSWCPHCVKGRAESYGHVRKVQNEGDVPTIGIDMPIIVAKDNKTKMIMARVVPSKGLDSYAVETVKRWWRDWGTRKSS